jgi:hypothetical protein
MVSGPWLSSSGTMTARGRTVPAGTSHEEQLGHRQLAYRMTGRLLDDLPQAVPRSGIGALIAAQGGRGLGGGHEPGLCRYRCSRPALTRHAGSASYFRYHMARSPDRLT